MGFLGTAASSFADIVLVVQITGFIILFSGIIYVKRGNFLKHFKMTRITVFLGILSLIWMGYSLMFYLPILSIGTAWALLILHSAIGSLALSTGVFFAFDRLIKKTRTPMRIVFLLWILALLSGISVYINFYVS